MASIPSVTSTLAGLQQALTTVAVSETTATTNGSNPLAQASGQITVDFYQSSNDAQAAQILGTVGWKPYSDSYDENATLAVVNDGTSQTYLGTYSDRQGTNSFGGAAWDTSSALNDPTQGLTPAYSVVLERDSAGSLSATITAADGTTSTIELTVPPAGSPAAPASTAPATPATLAAEAAVESANSAPAAPLAAIDPAKTAASTSRATTIVNSGPESLSLTFDVHGDYQVDFTSKNLGVTSFLDAAASYGGLLAVAPGSAVNLSG